MNMLRRLILTAALMAGATPAIAQVPAPVPALPDTERRTSYSITASTCACAVNFQLYGDSTDYQNWVEVWLNGVRLNYNDPVLGWSITSPSGSLTNLARPITNAVLTFRSAQTGVVQIVGARRPRRSSQFTQNPSARDFNQVLTDIIAQNRETWDKINDVTGRAVVAPPGETLAVLPKLSGRASMNACFDSSGNLTSCVAASSGSFAAGNGITFTGTGPTTIAANIAAGTGVQLTGTNPIIISTSSQFATPQDYGAVCNGATDDAIALQNWANALRDGGLGASPSALGCATSATITFTPSTNVAPVQGPHIVGNLKLVGHASLPLNSDLLRVWNPTAVSTTQNFYYAQFDSLELSNTTGTGACLSLRGYWGRIGQMFARTCGSDGVQFPLFTFGGIPDEYESNPTIGEVTCIDCLGYVVNNQIGIGATPRFGNIRGTVSGALTNGLGAANFSGSEQVNGNISYTGGGWGFTIQTLGGFGRPHEVFLQGAGDIDCAQNGAKVQDGEFMIVTGHRLNIEPPGFCNASSWPLTAYSIGKSGGSAGIVSVTLNPYITIRPSVTKANIGTIFDFNNDPQISNLTVNVQFSDQAGIIGTTMAFADIYKNINANATIRIVQNGSVVYDNTNIFTFAQLPPCLAGLNGVMKIVTDSNTITFRAAVAGGGANRVQAVCIGTTWVVGA